MTHLCFEMNDNYKNIYVDTNVLINYCTGQKEDVDALNYVFRIRKRMNLFTSSLAVVQTITNLQTKKSNRPAFTRDEIIDSLCKLLPKFTLLDLTTDDIRNGLSLMNEDVEDNIHYVLSQKMKCSAIITHNVKDFIFFNKINVLLPNESALKRKIK